VFDSRRRWGVVHGNCFYAGIDGGEGEEERRYKELLGAAPGAISRTGAVHPLPPMTVGLPVENAFDPGQVGEEVIERVVNRVFDALLAG